MLRLESCGGARVALAVAIMSGAPVAGCRSHTGTPPAEHPSAAVDADAGPPLPPPSSRRGVIVPTDVGAGTGPSPGGADPAAPPPPSGGPGP